MLVNAPVSAVLAVSDLEKAIDFYGNMLGLKKVTMPGEMEEGVVAFEAGQGTTLFIYEREGGSDASHTVVAFLVDDVEAIVADLSAKGVIIEQVEAGDMKTDERGIATVGPYQTAYTRDPEGNWISITTNPL
jgi:catechol 2,3-dioxygenase-like lactoylglutathione lyase family enzyme